MRALVPHPTHDSFGPSEPNPKCHLDRLSRFCTDNCRVPILYYGMPLSPSKLPIPMGDVVLWTPSNTWFLGPNQVLNPNSISIASAVFAGFTSVTDRPTDHATQSVTIGCIYIRSTDDVA